ncbi:hypothetical protein EA187_18170 [Lujinxingia sediminis]|uniref:RCC1-like domain-containing protein n=1 Tax=Lujinxingia sediminis TaxID=2480984 RepID=A0ABY0CNN1_9DELT|nr:hypothetical protein [Lujinxingia sediminis]RVU41584.1 hypothetical protein EA187_18170 [Lujinxingia sediminis]
MKNLTLLARHALTLGLLTALIACSDGPDTRTIPPNDNRPDVEDTGDTGDVGPDVEDPDACEAESDDALCSDNGAECGELTVVDSCGTERTVNCGDEASVCAPEETCGGAGEDNLCGCTPLESDTQLCQLSSYACGPLTAVDSCGTERTVNCGDETQVCGEFDTCGGGGIEGQCGCTPEFTDEEHCAMQQAECGEIAIIDSCGTERTLDCGAEDQVCTLFDTCGGGGEENICGCTPITCEDAQMLCGELDDGCGGTTQCDEFCVESVSAGASHACAIGSGKLKCWGRNTDGQLGNGTTRDERNPVDIDNLPTLVDVAPGGEHTCALSLNGEVFCWGANDRGQLGVGTTVDNPLPGSRAIISGATAIASGEFHSCAVVNGGVRCWGANDYGQIGNANLSLGTNIAVATPADGLSSGIVDVSAGRHHSCALHDNGGVSCWGRNRFGQVGNLIPGGPWLISAYGYLTNDPIDFITIARSPVAVPDIIDGAEITAGEDFNCVRSSTGQVSCWGVIHRPSSSGNTCFVPDGYTDSRDEPTGRDAANCAIWPTSGPAVGRFSERTGSAGPCGENLPSCPASYTCSENNRCERPEYPLAAAYINRFSRAPAPVTAPGEALTIEAGANHLCMVVDQPDTLLTNVRCFGLNSYGQVGDGTNNPWNMPVDLYYDVDDNIVRGEAMTAGDAFSCVLVDDQNIKCWGSNQYGQIGNSALLRDESYRPFDVKLEYAP